MVHAQQTIISANVSFAFSVGGQQLPAGEYAVRELGAQAILIASKHGHSEVLSLCQYVGPSKPSETKLVFNRVGDHYFLGQVWSGTRGEGPEIPRSKLERELRASNTATPGGVETVIVALR
jgi:hypothetical protein